MRPLGAALSLAMLVAPNARAEMDLGAWLSQDTATGDWGGLRSRAEDAGLTIEGNYQTDLLTNPIGGESQGFAYDGLMEISLDFDLEKIAGLEGTSFFIAGYWASGDDLSDTDIGNLIDVSQVFDGRTVRLGQMYLKQKLLGDALDVAIGRLTVGDDFATSDLYDSYVSSGVNGNPFALDENLSSFTEDSLAQWGVRAIVEPIKQIRLAAGVYNADPDVFRDGEHGVDFVLNPEDGVLVFAEAGYQWNEAEDESGLPGSATFGGYYDSSDFDTVQDEDDDAAVQDDDADDDSSEERDGNYGFYFLLDQMVYREGGSGGDEDSDQGLTPWAAFTFAPVERVNTIPFSASGGLVYQGLIPGRDDDVTALAVYYGKFSDKLEDQNAETVVEANHRFQLAPWLYVTPDFQYVIRPNGQSDIDDAAVFGGEIGIDF
jgi:porin